MVDIYRAGFQLTKVRGFMIVALLCAVGAVYWGWDLFNTYGLNPGDGGVLAPLWQRLAWGLSVAGLGLAFLAGMWIYGRRYVTGIRYDQAADTLHIGTLEFLAARVKVYPASSVVGADYRHGRLEGEGVNAPWYFVKLKDRSSRLILDAQGIFPDRQLAGKLLRL